MNKRRKSPENSEFDPGIFPFHAEVEERFGILPNFFRLTPDAPEITDNLWKFAQFGYLDNPLPSLFKERLFVYLSQFCHARYCIARHVGFLAGLGNPSGDPVCTPEKVEDIVRMLQRPLPEGDDLQTYLEFCENHREPIEELPKPDTELEQVIFACAAHLFQQTKEAPHCLEALRWVLGPVLVQYLLVFLTFVQTAHYWTRLHPELETEQDINSLLEIHEALATCVLHKPEAKEHETGQLLLEELDSLRRERDEAELLSAALASIGDGVIATDVLGNITRLNSVAEQLTGWSNEEAVGRPVDAIFQTVSEETGHSEECSAYRVLRAGEVLVKANRTLLMPRSGSQLAIEESAAPIRTHEGEMIGTVVVFRDVTERRQQERMREEQSRLLRLGAEIGEALTTHGDELQEMLQASCESMVRNLDAAFARIWTLNEAEQVLELQASAGMYTHIDGKHARVPVGKYKIGLIAHERSPHLTNEVIGDPRVPEQEWARRERLVAFAGFPMMIDNQVVGVMGMFSRNTLSTITLDAMASVSTQIALAIQNWRNVQAERVALDEVRESRELLRVSLASIGDAVIRTDREGRVTQLNRIAEQLTGWSNEDAIGELLTTVFNIVNAKTREKVENPAFRALRDGMIVGLANHTILIARDGQERFIDDSAAPILNEQGDILGAVLVFRDISSKYQAEARIRESELRYRLVGQAANDVIWDWDLATNQVTWNEGLQTRFHYAAEDVGPEAQWWIEHIHPEDRTRIADDIHGAIDGGREVWQNEYRFRRADGSYARVLDRGRIVHSDDGTPVRMVGSMLDLTEKLKTEAELREARSRLESTLAAAEVGTWEFDPLQNIIKADANLIRMFGMADETRPTDSLESYLKAIHPDDIERVTSSIDYALNESSIYETEYRLIQPDGAIRWVVARGRVERDETGQAMRMPGVVVDITERKLAERALQKSEEQLHLALEAGELGAWNVELATSRLITDERCRSIILGSTEPVTYEEAFHNIHPDDVQRVRDAIEAAINPDDPAMYAEEYRVIHPNGDIRWIFAKGRATFEQTEQGRRAITFDGTVMDITRQRELREELSQVAARLSEADRRKDEFLATLAHELRNPLAPIRTGLEVMRLSQNNPAMLEEIRETMERQTQQLISLVDDLLDVSRITTGKLELRKCRVKLSDVIESAVESSRPFIADSGHELTVSTVKEPIQLEADPNRLVQVLSNLLNNSTKYTPEGGHIELTAERQGSEVVLSVTDDGIGIPADAIDRVFEMFAQIDRPEEKGYTGLGIGLSLVKSLVEMHDGRIEVHSDGPGQGCTFRVRLPILETGEEQQAATANPGVSASGKLKVLVVDDNQAAASMLSMVVKMLGNDVRTAHDGQQAIDVGMEYRPHVILMDIGMPVLNGYEAARRIRQLPWGENIQLIALTGWGQEEDRIRTREAGFDHHLVKPAEPADLQALLNQVDEQRVD